jgi:hypothetical protein
MSSFVFKVSIYFITVAALCRITGALLADGWEDHEYYTKEGYFLANEVASCNTLFFGSSRTFSQVDPIIFDSVTGVDGVYTHSFVLAESSTFVNESLYQIEELISQKLHDSGIRTVFVEVDDFVSILEGARFKPDAIFYISWSTILPIMKRIWAAPRGITKKMKDSSIHIVAFLVAATEFGYGTAKLMELKRSFISDSDTIWLARKGHRPLDNEFLAFNQGNFLRRHAQLLADTTCIDSIYKSIARASTTDHDHNTEVAHAYTSLAKQLSTRGIQLVYVLPMQGRISPPVKALYQALPGEFKIDMTNVAATIPELHQANYWFDPGHLNIHGTKLYTQALAREWVKLLPNRDSKQPSQKQR